jgi:hypothetical protein
MLSEILAANDLDIADLLGRTLLDTPGRKLHQMLITKTPDDRETKENAYRSIGGLCKSITLFPATPSMHNFTNLNPKIIKKSAINRFPH